MQKPRGTIVKVEWDGRQNSLAVVSERFGKRRQKQGLSATQKFMQGKGGSAWWFAERNVVGHYDLHHIVNRPEDWV